MYARSSEQKQCENDNTFEELESEVGEPDTAAATTDLLRVHSRAWARSSSRGCRLEGATASIGLRSQSS